MYPKRTPPDACNTPKTDMKTRTYAARNGYKLKESCHIPPPQDKTKNILEQTQERHRLRKSSFQSSQKRSHSSKIARYINENTDPSWPFTWKKSMTIAGANERHVCDTWVPWVPWVFPSQFAHVRNSIAFRAAIHVGRKILWDLNPSFLSSAAK